MNIRTIDDYGVERIAQLVGDAYTGGELQRFFHRAGFSVPRHDGSTKWRWVLPHLQQFNRSPGAIERVILRYVDPRELPGNPDGIASRIKEVNTLLATEGWEVYLDVVTPRTRKIAAYFPNSNPEVIEFVPAAPPDFSPFVQDPSLESILRQRWAEAQTCVNAEAYLSAVVMMGSILEASLLSAMLRNPKSAHSSKSAPKDQSGNVIQCHDWKLFELIVVAHDCGWIEPDAKDFSQSLRDYRNLVHPWHQRLKDFSPNRDTCAICWEVVKASINDLIDTFSVKRSATSSTTE